MHNWNAILNNKLFFTIPLLCILITHTGVPAEGAAEEIEVSGSFFPNSPPIDPVRTTFRDNCIIELKQGYDISGTLSGTMEIDFRIAVRGPCGSPPGTFDENWIATGTYSARLRNSAVLGDLMYVADVQAGGDVSGKIVITGAIVGTLAVSGNFNSGMNYEGRLGL